MQRMMTFGDIQMKKNEHVILPYPIIEIKE